MKDKLKFISLIIIAIAIAGLCGLLIFKGVKSKTDGNVHPVASFEIENYGTVEIELYPEYAPNTVTNFVALIQKGYYNNKILYGKDDLCIYMGRTAESDTDDSTTETTEEESDEYDTPQASIFDSSIEKDSADDYDYEINGEFIANGFTQNILKHEKGVISLNRSDYSQYGLSEEGYNSGKAMFSVMMSDDSSDLNGIYCAFGKIINGMDIMEKIYSECKITEDEEDTSSIEVFTEAPVIKSASVETYGVDYGTPVYHEAYDISSYLNQYIQQYYQSN